MSFVARRALCGASLSLLLPRAALATESAPLDLTHLRGIGHSLPPLSFASGAQVQGLCPDLLHAMARHLALPLSLEIQPLTRLLMVNSLGPETVIFPVARTPERELSFGWIGPLLPRRVRIYRLSRRANLHFPGLERLGTQRIIVNHGTASLRKLQRDEQVSPEKIQIATGYPAALKMLAAERAEFLVMNELAAIWTVRTLDLPSDTLSAVADFDSKGDYWLCVKASSAVLAARLQFAFDDLREQGRLDAYKKAYGL